MAEITLERLSKIFPSGTAAVVNCSLTVPSGEWLALVGPSGCGKTTLLRLIAGLERPTGGTIRIGGRVVNDLPPAERDIAMVFQRPALFPNRTAGGNIRLGMELRRGAFFWHGVTDAEEAKLRETAGALGIEELLNRYPAELSGGEQQRVALARALVERRAVGLLDEPLGHLDAPLRRQLLRELPLLRERFPTTMVIVTHDPAEALALGDRIAVMQDGLLVQVGRAEDLRARPANALVADLFRTI